ncbi:MAG TPA: 2OG-Fe(II) oxygenase [Actinophytocola sp.]|nr:2OG-Fe(II) oxygenase [Actinophytocola sp.]
MAPPQFHWDTENVGSQLCAGWQRAMIDVAKNFATERVLRPPHATSREDSSVSELPVHGVSGQVVQEQLPWLIELYEGKFKEIGERFRGEPLSTAADPRYAVVLNVQFPGERYECHVDTNPVEGLLYATSHPQGTGGDLAVARNVDAVSRKRIDEDCDEVYPMEGDLVFFDGRFHPHYIRPLVTGEIRVAAAMNYYTASVPESTRPPDLNEYLYGA